MSKTDKELTAEIVIAMINASNDSLDADSVTDLIEKVYRKLVELDKIKQSMINQ